MEFCVWLKSPCLGAELKHLFRLSLLSDNTEGEGSNFTHAQKKNKKKEHFLAVT